MFALPSLSQSIHTGTAYPLFSAQKIGKEKIKVVNLSELNSPDHDYCPVMFNDGILFTSDRINPGSTKGKDSDFYFSSFTLDGKLETPKIYNSDLNSEFQEGMATISPDGKTLVFSRDIKTIERASGFSDVRLYSATWKNGSWGNIKKMSINMRNYSSGHPAFSPSGKELYFVSNRPGGSGATDIYVSTLKKGKWTKPKNLGSKVNTLKSELFPYVDSSGVLYFSSNRKGGQGLMDIYVSSTNADGKWSRAVNMGAPYNSNRNDFGFLINKDGKSGYLSSNRSGGIGGNDIYYWGPETNQPDESITTDNVNTNELEDELVSTTIYVLDDKSELPLANAKVSMKDEYENIMEWTSDSSGKIELERSVSELNLLTVEHPLYGKRLFNPALINDEVKTFSVALSKQTCVKLSGKLVDESGKPIQLDKVRVALANLSTLEKEETLTNSDGSFEFCLDCKSDFSIKAFPTDYYLDEIFVSTKNLDCNDVGLLYAEMKLSKVGEEDEVLASRNMNTLDPKISDKEAVIRNAKNKSMLESISIAEGEEEDFETEIEIVEEEIEMIDAPVEETTIEEPALETIEEEIPVEAELVLPPPAENDFTSIPNIYYDFNSFEIKEEDKRYLKDLSDYLKTNPNKNLSINSFTDTKGKKAYNKWLSKRRAQEVMEYLVMNGVEKARLKAVGKGELEEIANEETAPEMLATTSRRTEFKILDNLEEVNESDAGLGKVGNVGNSGEVYVSNIHYGFDAHRLNDDSSIEVEKLIKELKMKPDLKVEIRSHTDSRGNEEYNQWLSQKRANEVVRYITAKGIEANRLTARGYGETELINGCSDNVDCSKSDHYANRRTEFVFKN